MKKLFISIFYIIFLISCHNQMKFDKEKWLYKIDGEFPHRKAMLKDLTKNYKIVGLAYEEVVNLLGEPNIFSIENLELTYSVYQYYGWDIDPIHTIFLEIKLNSDSIVNKFEINEWKK